MLGNKLERVLHICTKMAVKAFYRQNEVKCITFLERMTALKLLTYKQKRLITAITFVLRIMSGTIDSSLINEFLEFQNHNLSTRQPNLFNIPNKK